MALSASFKDVIFGIGDKIVVYQKVTDANKTRLSMFEGMVIAIRGREENKSFTVRRIGTAKIGIERIFPLASTTLEKIEVKRHGMMGSKHAKLFFIRDKSKKEIEKMYDRSVAKQIKK
jgi:large subunit ribosomal protein L19